MRKRSSKSRIKGYEGGIDEALKVCKLNSQSGTQVVSKIGQKCLKEDQRGFQGGVEENRELGSRISNIAKKKLSKNNNEVVKEESKVMNVGLMKF